MKEREAIMILKETILCFRMMKVVVKYHDVNPEMGQTFSASQREVNFESFEQ